MTGPTAMLDRSGTRGRSPAELVDRAAAAGSRIEYLGRAELFTKPRWYAATASDWIVSPLSDDALWWQATGSDRVTRAVPLPGHVLDALRRLDRAGLRFPAVYVAHELERRSEAPDGFHPGVAVTAGKPYTTLEPELARALVPPIPEPAATVAASQRFGRVLSRATRALGLALPVAAGVVAAPIVHVAQRARELDPMLFGAVPDRTAAAGCATADWYLLARWTW